MSDDKVTHLHPVKVGAGFKIAADAFLEEQKGEFETIALVGVRADGSIAVGGTDGSAESALLFQYAINFLVNNMTVRS